MVALVEMTALPAAVTGPVLMAPFFRLASTWAGVRVVSMATRIAPGITCGKRGEEGRHGRG